MDAQAGHDASAGLQAGVTHAVVNVAAGDLRRSPGHESELLTQPLLGAVVSVLDRADAGRWVRVRLEDGYEGWMRSWLLAPCSKEQAEAWDLEARFIVRRFFATVLDAPRGDAGPVAPVFLLGRLKPVGTPKSGGWVEVALPDGRRGWLPAEAERSVFSSEAGPGPVALGVARMLLGVPYLWGGTSPSAVDCSGLTWLAWGLAGVRLSRDAWMQARDIPAASPEEASPGDLLFFGEPEGRISHVAVVVSGRRFIHSQGFVRGGSLDRRDPDFHPRLSTLLRGAGSPAALMGR